MDITDAEKDRMARELQEMVSRLVTVGAPCTIPASWVAGCRLEDVVGPLRVSMGHHRYMNEIVNRYIRLSDESPGQSTSTSCGFP